EVRALMSAADSSALWELRCAVREGLIDYLQREFPGSLARYRAEVAGTGAPVPPRGRAGGAAGEEGGDER
ncbi:MAG: mechanosensitive ion channel family protein, partial [Spirochaetales bacterium]|nr:mechanosensitive ion channel family protein [Spirochaetales bacterium]